MTEVLAAMEAFKTAYEQLTKEIADKNAKIEELRTRKRASDDDRIRARLKEDIAELQEDLKVLLHRHSELEGRLASVAAAQLPAAQPAAAAASPGQGRASALPRIDESQELRAELRAEQRAFEQQMRALVAQKGVVVGESATTLGEQVVRTATREQLVTVTDAARRAAEGLLWRAGQVGVQVRRATRLQSQLKEAGSAGVQQLVSELVKAQPPGQLCAHDVHTTESVCGRLRPDLVVTLGPQLLPNSTVLVVDLKRQDGSYNSPAHIHQLASYGVALLDQLPATSRSKVLLAVTDLRRIQFLCVTRQASGGFSYQLSAEMGEAIPALCAALLAPPQRYGASPPPELKLAGQAVELVSFLGAGATSSVYECRLPNSQGEAEAVAAKVPLEPHTTSHEQRVLQELAAAGEGCPCIPRIMGMLDNNKGLLLAPVGKPLAAEGMLTDHPRLFNGFGGLVHALREAHERGWVHRDVRPDNLVLVGESSLYLIDWGCATQQDEEPIPASSFCGTIKYASDRVLQLLAAKSDQLDARPEDDLQSLVKAMWAVSHPLEAQVLAPVGKQKFSNLLKTWQDVMLGHPVWSRLMDAAAAAQYDAVAQGLADRFD